MIERFPFLTACLGIALLTAMDALVKALSSGYPAFQIVFLRFLITGLIIGVAVMMRGQTWPPLNRMRVHLVRALLMVVTASSFFYALGHLPLADLFALSFTSPIFVALLAAVALKEPLNRSILSAIGLGFLGMLVIVSGAGTSGVMSGYPPLALACALLSPVAYACSVVLLRAQTAQDPITVIVAVQASLAALLLSPVMVSQFVMPTERDWLLFGALGLLGTAGYLAFAGALKHLPAARFSVVEYTGLIWAALIGFFFFTEVPAATVWYGAALIIAGCLIVVRERSANKAG
jgi:drug/metabolite transporter (DMT)-like permease